MKNEKKEHTKAIPFFQDTTKPHPNLNTDLRKHSKILKIGKKHYKFLQKNK